MLRRKLNVFYPYKENHVIAKCIFFHIPKNAGTTILKGLGGHKNEHRIHASWSEYHNRSPYLFKELFKFSVVRNPLDRVVSAYFFIKQNKFTNEKDSIFSENIRNNYPTFKIFVDNYLNHDTIWEHILLRPQWYFIIDENGKLVTDYLIHFESFNSEIELISNKLGIKSNKFGIHNKGVRNSYEQYYDTKSIQKIKNLYAKDFAKFGY
jgi:hypothetical protein